MQSPVDNPVLTEANAADLANTRWYLIYAKPREEERALENLERQGYHGYLPRIERERLRRGKITTVVEPLFPRYLFIRMVTGVGGQSWLPIRSTRGVHHLVRFGQQLAEIDPALIDALRCREVHLQQHPPPVFTPGESVRITDGPFAGIVAVYSMSEGRDRVRVLFEMIGKPVSLSISPLFLDREGR